MLVPSMCVDYFLVEELFYVGLAVTFDTIHPEFVLLGDPSQDRSQRRDLSEHILEALASVLNDCRTECSLCLLSLGNIQRRARLPAK